MAVPMNRRDALKALMALPAIERISVAQIKPNDVIVLECGGHISSECAERLKAMLKDVWPEHECVVLADGLRMKVVAH